MHRNQFRATRRTNGWKNEKAKIISNKHIKTSKLKLSEHRKSETTENLNKFKREIERDGEKTVAGTNLVKKTRQRGGYLQT